MSDGDTGKSPDGAQRRCPECGQENPLEQSRCGRCGLELSAADLARGLLGTVVGSYRLEEVRRATPTGTAFGAIEEGTDRWVEVKVVSLSGASDAVRERFRREAGRRLRHPHLVGVERAGQDGDLAYVVTDARAEEVPLAELGRLEPTRAVSVARAVAEALACVHDAGLVHRGVSPQSVLLDPERGSVRLADLGLLAGRGGGRDGDLSVTASGEVVGDPAYAAPEVARLPSTSRSDLYALAATLAFALCGKEPFGAALDGREPIQLGEVEGLDAGVVDLVAELSDPDPDGRPGKASTVARRLARALGEDVAEDATPTPTATASSGEVVLARYEEHAGELLDVATLEALPLPLARALVAAWNERPEPLPTLLAWEGLTRFVAVVAVSLARATGQALPAALATKPFTPTFGRWLGLAREAAAGLDPEHALAGPLKELLEGKDGLLRLLSDDVTPLRNRVVHKGERLEPAAVARLGERLREVTQSPFFQRGQVLTLGRLGPTEGDRVVYEPLILHGTAPRRGQAFTAPLGLASGRVYWRLVDAPRFLELDPLAAWEDERLLLLERWTKKRPRYDALDGEPSQVLKDREPALIELRRLAGGDGGAAAEPAAPDETAATDGDATAATQPDSKEPADDPQIGRVLAGTYRIAGKLGQGGMGVVYRGWDTRLRREVALKLLTGSALNDPQTRERFATESRVLATLGHPNAVRVYDVGADGATPFFAMEVLPGPTLDRWIKQQDRTPSPSRDALRQRVRWVRDAARAVHEAHEQGVVHRDLKPANLMLDARGQVRVLDFGLAHVKGADLTKTRAQLGTPRYMAPEQVLDASRVDRRTDVYALGVTLSALLTLEKPFADTDDEHALLKRVAEDGLPRLEKQAPGLPGDLTTVVGKATERRAEDRYASAAELADDLERWLEDLPIQAKPPGIAARVVKFARREPAKAAALAILVGATAVTSALGLVAWGQAQAAEVARGEAEAEAGRARDAEAEAEAQRETAQGEAARARAAEAEAAAERDRVLRLADVKRLQELLADASEARAAAFRGETDPIDAWLARAEALLGRAAEHRQRLEVLRRAGEHSGDGAWRLADSETQWQHDVLAELVAGLEALARDGALARGRAARALADEAAERWAAALPRIEVHYGLEDLEPIDGLVPLGPDPESGLWELWHPASGERPLRGETGRYTITGETGVVFVLLPPGPFLMGSAADDPAALADERPQHEVSVAPFLIAKYELTQGQWTRLAGTNPSYHQEDDPALLARPVETVKWFECRDLAAGRGWRLPSEAEWEYACRARSTGDYGFDGGVGDLGRHAWFEDNSGSGTHPVGTKAANAWGLHDLHGNVWEWVQDRYQDSYTGAPTDGSAWEVAGAIGRVLRGGSWFVTARGCRAAYRRGYAPGVRDGNLGFRPARWYR